MLLGGLLGSCSEELEVAARQRISQRSWMDGTGKSRYVFVGRFPDL